MGASDPSIRVGSLPITRETGLPAGKDDVPSRATITINEWR